MSEIHYEERFGTALPAEAYPLPLPHKVTIPPEGCESRWWLELLDSAERHVNLSPEEVVKMGDCLPAPPDPSDPLLSVLCAKITVGMSGYTMWSSIPSEEDTPENFPRGVTTLINRAREKVLRAVNISRARDWAQLIVDEYTTAFERCCILCDAERRGHLSETGEPLSFSKEHVEKAMHGVRGFVGLVDYQHIKRVLLTLAE